ncbi:MAG: hypothetical protein IIA89_15145 [Chloroflexi bacterium]|nr:hypothetical protein [Chloroflexota bacterium]
MSVNEVLGKPALQLVPKGLVRPPDGGEIREGFLPKQMKARALTEDHAFVLYGGARGPGKSFWLRWTLLFWLLRWWQEGHRNVRVALFCETYTALKDRQISKINMEFPRWLGEVKSTKADGLGFYLKPEFGGGAILLRNLDDPSKYQSAEFAGIAIDELTKNTFETFEILRGSLRWPGISWRPFLAATNPGGIGHLWVKALWVDRSFTGFPQLKDRARDFAFVQALPRDNPYLDQAYWNELNSLSEGLRKAWVEGSWLAFVGQVFTEWNPLEHVCDPFKIPGHWIRRRGIDGGYLAPWVTLWSATEPETGRIYIYRELHGTGVTDRRQAALVKKYSKGETYRVSFGDPAMWAKKNVQGIVTSTADEYARGGIPLLAADNRRIDGWMKVHRALANLPDGKPGLIVFKTAEYLIRSLPALPYDPIKVEDVDTKSDDHAGDALRYLLSDYLTSPEEKDSVGQRRWERQAEALGRAFG